MNPGPGNTSTTLQTGAEQPVGAESDQISQNIAAVLEFYAREEQKISHSQRILERISGFVGQPAFLGIILIFVTLWILADLGLGRLGVAEFDTTPIGPENRGGAATVALGRGVSARVSARESRLNIRTP